MHFLFHSEANFVSQERKFTIIKMILGRCVRVAENELSREREHRIE